MILCLLRLIGAVPYPAIKKEEALQIAIGVAKKNNWPWRGAVIVSDGFRAWSIRTNAKIIGQYIVVSVSNQDGHVIDARIMGGLR